MTFDGAGNGITEDHFAAKLLGKTDRGKLLFGYARLPWLDYLEPALSALPPSIVKQQDGVTIALEVQNFGQVASLPAPLNIVHHAEGRENQVASGQVPALAPFEKTVVQLSCGKTFEPGESSRISAVICPPGQRPVTLQRTLP